MEVGLLIAGAVIAPLGVLIVWKARRVGAWFTDREVDQTRNSSFFSPEIKDRLIEMYDFPEQRQLGGWFARVFGGLMIVAGAVFFIGGLVGRS